MSSRPTTAADANPSDGPRATALALTTAIVAGAVLLYIAAPLMAPALLFVVPFVTTYWLRRDAVAPDRVNLFAAVALAALVAWFATTMLWSEDRKGAATALLVYVTAALFVLLVAAQIARIAADVRRALALAFTFGFGVGIWLLFEEHLTGLYLRRLVNHVVPLTRAQSIELRGDGGWIVALVKHASNKNTAAAMILTWPWLLISATLARRPWQQVLRYGTAAALVTAILLSDHETSKVAIVASAIVFLLATLSRQLAFALVAVAWFVATLAIVPAAMFAYGSGAHLIEAVQYSGRHRLVIWGVTAERALDRPLRGHGLASTRVIDEMTPPEQRRPVPGTNIPQGTNMHSHNVFLQTWHETGMPGAVLLFLAGLPVLAWLAARPATTARYLYAGFIAALVLASLSWSLVASWYIATFALAAIWMLIADVVGRGGMPVLRSAPNDPAVPADQLTPSS